MRTNHDVLPDETLRQKAKRKGLWIYVLSFVVMPFSYIIKVLVSRELSVEDVGVMYSLLGFVGILSIYNDLGLTDALQYYIPKYTIEKRWEKVHSMLYSVMSMQLISGCLLGGAMYFSAPRLASNYFSTPQVTAVIQYFGLYFLLLNIFQALQSFYFALQHVQLEKTIELIRMGFVCLLVVLMWQYSLLDLHTFAAAWLVGLVIAVIMSCIIFYHYYRKRFFSGTYILDYADVRKWLAYGFWSLLGANAWTIISQIDLQLILLYLGKEQAGYWTNYLSITSLLIFIFVPLLSFCFPRFTELITKQQFQLLKLVRKRLIITILVFGVVLWLSVLQRGEMLTLNVFGNKYGMTATLLEYSARILVTPLLGILNFQFIRSFGRVRRVTLAQISIVLLHVIVSYLVITMTGKFIWMTIVLHLSHLLFFLVTEWYIYKRISPLLNQSQI